MSNILILLTSHDALGNTGEKTGFHAEEFTTPYYHFLDNGDKVTLASVKGGESPLDPNTVKPTKADNAQSVQRYLDEASAQQAIKQTKAVSAVKADDYDAIFLPGGHGVMWDYTEAEVTRLIEDFAKQDKIIGTVCHAPAALINAKDEKGRPLVAGKRFNSFTDEEERAVGKENIVPFLLETKLRDLGADFEAGTSFSEYSVQDGNLISGQNPQSARAVAQRITDALESRRSAAA